jgi:AcrR family transcriptional regulator
MAGPARRNRPAQRRAGVAPPDVRESILEATKTLLAETRFDELTVAQILKRAAVSRASFYFYFEGKHDVLAELVKRAVVGGHEAARPWLANPSDKASALRAGTADGAALWQANAPVLRAIVENWRTDARLTSLWLAQMQTFTDAAVAQINADPQACQQLDGLDIPAVAASLTWLSERLYYLAANGVPPFDDQATLVDMLTYVWASTLYGNGTSVR